MNKLTKSVIIPAAAFAVTVTGVSAFNSEVLEEVGLSDSQIEAFAEARELRQAGDYEEAREILEAADINRETLQEVKSALREHRAEVRAAIEAALEDGDYADFMDAIAGTHLEEAIDDEDDFELFLEAHELREEGDYEGARAILDELGIERKGHKERGHKDGRGERAERIVN